MKLIKREVIAVKIEATYGVEEAPTAATDSVLVENVGWSHAGARMVERNPVKPSLGKLQSVFAGTLMEMSFDVEMKGSGTNDVPPELGVLLRACGFGETINVGASVVYSPVSTNHESLTMHYFEDGSRYVLTGCRGTVSGALNTGEIGKLSFTLTGHIATPTDVALPSPTYDTTVPAPVINAGFTVGGNSPAISAFAFDLGLTLATPPDMAKADGYGEILITDREITGSIDPEYGLVAVTDYINEWKSGTNEAIVLAITGGGAGNQYQIDLPTAYYKELSPGDRDGIRTMEISFGVDDLSDTPAPLTLTFS